MYSSVSVCLFYCLSLHSPGCHSTVFTASLDSFHTTSYIIVLKVADFDVKASLSNKS